MARRNPDRDTSITRGTKSVFADLGYPDAAERQAKLRLAYALNQLLHDRGLPQNEAAKVLGVAQPKVSALRNDKLAGFSVERLMNDTNARFAVAGVFDPFQSGSSADEMRRVVGASRSGVDGSLRIGTERTRAFHFAILDVRDDDGLGRGAVLDPLLQGRE
jgi:predicted XRE-type DNA-binding protein